MADCPYGLQAAGRWRAAGYPYESAAAIADSPDPADRLAALAELDMLGAGALAAVLRTQLRELGLTGIPRGPLSATRRNVGRPAATTRT